MSTLHAFGCSITQGYALPDVVKPLTEQEIHNLGREITADDVHVYAPSEHAWPAVLGRMLNQPVHNHARRGACFQQIARQCAVAANTIKPNDTVIVMWTYLSRLSFQWPARTSVPFCNIVDSNWGWTTRILGFNKWFGLDSSRDRVDEHIHKFIHDSAQHNLDPMGTYNRYYNNLILQTMTAGFLANTGARVIHLSVEPERYLDQLATAQSQLDPSLREPWQIPNPCDWYTIDVDHLSSMIIHDPDIPKAENDMHPSVQHHENFAKHLYNTYFSL